MLLTGLRLEMKWPNQLWRVGMSTGKWLELEWHTHSSGSPVRRVETQEWKAQWLKHEVYISTVKANIYTTGRTELDVISAAVVSSLPPPPPSRLVRGREEMLLGKPVALSAGGQLGVVVASRVGNSLISSSLIHSFAQIAQIKWVTVSDSLRSLRTNERLWVNCSGHSCQKSNCEQIA